MHVVSFFHLIAQRALSNEGRMSGSAGNHIFQFSLTRDAVTSIPGKDLNLDRRRKEGARSGPYYWTPCVVIRMLSHEDQFARPQNSRRFELYVGRVTADVFIGSPEA